MLVTVEPGDWEDQLHRRKVQDMALLCMSVAQLCTEMCSGTFQSRLTRVSMIRLETVACQKMISCICELVTWLLELNAMNTELVWFGPVMHITAS